MTYEEIKENRDNAYKKYTAFREAFERTWDFNRPYEEYYDNLFNSDEYKEYDKWDGVERLNRIPTMRNASEFDLGCRMEFDDFLKTVKTGYISNWDGSGYYGNETEVSNIGIDIAQMRHDIYRKDFTHIYWYNK